MVPQHAPGVLEVGPRPAATPSAATDEHLRA